MSTETMGFESYKDKHHYEAISSISISKKFIHLESRPKKIFYIQIQSVIKANEKSKKDVAEENFKS